MEGVSRSCRRMVRMLVLRRKESEKLYKMGQGFRWGSHGPRKRVGEAKASKYVLWDAEELWSECLAGRVGSGGDAEGV